MSKLQKARNRKEKRRLLAEFNQQQELVWGQAKSIAAIENSQSLTAQNLKKNAQEAGEGKVYNEATHSYIDKSLHEEIMKKETRSANPDASNQKKLTQILSKNQKLHSVNVYSKTQKFEYKVNLENEKQRQLFREHMAQRNQLIEENQHIIEAIEEGKRVRAYFETDDQARQFVAKLADLKEQEKRGYHFEEIDKASKMTREAHPVIASRNDLSRAIVGGAALNKMMIGQNMQEQNNLLEGDNETKLIGGEVGPKGPQVLPEKLERKEVTN